jgi:glycosyltransferase involved in cell wall biosynthesis
MTSLSIVVPCFNEEEVIVETTRQLVAILERLCRSGKVNSDSRIYLVDDGSRDNTWRCIEEMVESGYPVVGIKLSRNCGHQNALLAGLHSAVGDAVISVDADLQDDLGAIELMLDQHLAGVHVVYGVRKRRDTDTRFKRFTAAAFYRLIAVMGAETVFNHADFRLLSRPALDALKRFDEINLFLRGVVPLLGYRSGIVEYDRTARFAGESKYPLRKMIALGLNAITSFSVAPLRLISLFGFLVSGGSLVVTVWAFWVAMFSAEAVPGWASTVLPIYFLGGVQLLAIGVIGEYIGNIYMEVKRRPRFVIEQTVQSTIASDRLTSTLASTEA